MTKPYHEFGDNDNHEDDEELGALGSLLSWDDNYDAVGEGPNPPPLSDRLTHNSSTLPNLVSFNPRDGGLDGLQNLTTNTNNGTPNLSIPMPTQIDYSQNQGTIPTANTQIGRLNQKELCNADSNNQQYTMNQTMNSHHQEPNQQQQLQQNLGQHVQQMQTQNPQQHQMQQAQQYVALQQPQTMEHQNQQQLQHQQQSQQQQQQLLCAASQSIPSLQQQASANNETHQQNDVGRSTLSQQPSGPSNLGAFSFFPQNGMMSQPQNAKPPQMGAAQSLPQAMVPTAAPVQEQRTDQQVSQFPFGTDANALIRQLQVAQLQQQFNSFQQGIPARQQAGGMAVGSQMPATPQQQVHDRSQQKAPPPAVATGQKATMNSDSQRGSAPVAAPPRKRPPVSAKPTPPPTNPTPSRAAYKASVVSASDTDGELSSHVESASVKSSSKPSASEASISKKSDIDTSKMTPAEKAKVNRDRNREHARNTRLRKKAYLEKLKTTVDELCKERDSLVSERTGAANVLVDMHNTRTEVLMSFFALRSANEKRRELWASILDESCFACVLPVTPYRSFPASEVQVSKCQRTILGIDGMMSDTASLHVLLNSLVDRSRYPNATIVFRYTLVTEEAVVAGNQMMARWVMSTLNATQCGARMEVVKQGMLCCKFNSAHKIIGLELMFDVMALMLQLKQAAGADTFSVIPNTVQTCQRSFDKPMVMTLAEEPYTIVQVNKLWEDVTGYKAEEVVGKTSCRILEGEETDTKAVEVLMNEIRFKRPASAMLVNYKKSGERFRNFFLVYPLSTDSRITHYLHLSSFVDKISYRKGTKKSSMPIQNPAVSALAQGQIPPVNPAQQAFFNGIQNLQGAAPMTAGMIHPGSQPTMGLGQAASGALGGQTAQQQVLPSAYADSTQYTLGASKRPHSGFGGGALSRKQAKAGNGQEGPV